MSFPMIPLPGDNNSKAAEFFHKMDAEAKAQGKSGWLELMIEQSPDMAGIFRRMVGGEIAARKNKAQTPES